MALKNFAKLGLFLLTLGFAASIPAQAQDYPLNFDKDNAVVGRDDRYVRSLSIGEQSIAVYSSGSNYNNVYVDKTSESFTVTAGEEVTLVMDWYAAGTWMHTYAYVDWDRDGQFKADDVSNEGVIAAGQDIVTFSFWSYDDSANGYNSAGEAVSNGPGTIAMPAFTIPADAEGEYRLRFKLDWNSLDPGGCPSGNNIFVSNGVSPNGGCIVDVTLVVENNTPDPVGTFKAYCARGYFSGGADSNNPLVRANSADDASEFALIDYEGSTFLYDATNKTFVCHQEADVSNLGLSGNYIYCHDADLSKIVRGVQLLEDTGFEAYPYHFEDEQGNYLNMDGRGNLYFNKWVDFEGGAGGNTYAIEGTGELDPTEAIAILDAYFHPGATYSIIVFDRETEKEYTVAEGLPTSVGTVISELPDEYKKDYCTYSVGDPLTVEQGDNNVLLVDVEYNLPFEEGKWYNMTIRSMYAVNDGTSPINTVTAKPDATEEGGLWQFTGNPYDGVVVTNKLAGDGFSLGYDGIVIDRPGADVYMKAGETAWEIAANTNGFILRTLEDNTVYLHNRNPNLATCSLSEWPYVHEDAGSTIAIEEVEIEDEPVETVIAINLQTGRFTATNAAGNFASMWESNEAPALKFYPANQPNNMASNDTDDTTIYRGDGLKIFNNGTSDGGAATPGVCEYIIEVEAGYVITGYTLKGNAYDSDITVATVESATVFTTDENSVEVTLDNVERTSFTLTGEAAKFLNAVITVNVKKLVTEDVTFTIYDEDDTHVWTEVVPVEVGTTITELPESLKRPFCEYTYPRELTVGPDEHNTFLATVSYTLPFTTDEAPYFVTVGGQYIYITEDGAVANATTLDEENDNYKWAFSGDPYNGINVQNVGTTAYLSNDEIPAGSWGTALGTSADRTPWDIVANGDGFSLYRDGTEYIKLWEGAISSHNWANNSATDDARILVEPATTAPEMVTVTFTVTDEEGNVLHTFTYDVEAGTELTNLPEDMQAPWTTYEGEPITVSANDNEFFATATFDEPFTNQFVYILTEDNTVAFCSADYSAYEMGILAGFNENAIAEDSDGDLMDGNNWALDDENTLTAFRDAELYQASLAIHPQYIFQITGNPYEGYTLTNECDLQLKANGKDLGGIVVNNFVDLELDEGTAFNIIPIESIYEGDATRPAAPRRAPGQSLGEYLLAVTTPAAISFVAQHPQVATYSIMTDDVTEATVFHFVTVDEETYLELMEDWVLRVGVDKVTTEANAAAIYDLQGRRISKLQKGVNIVNGKKVLVK